MSPRPCVECGRPAVVIRRNSRRKGIGHGRPGIFVASLPDHDLCPACYRDQVNRDRAAGKEGR